MKLTQEMLIGLIREEMEKTIDKPITQTTSDIITTLESLYDSIVEDLDSIEEELLEAEGTPSAVMQWMWWSPKARKSQSKVNKVKMNIVALEFARDNAKADAKSKLGDKVKAAKEQKKTLQSMVDDKFSSKGEITRRSLSSEKIKGQLAAIKATTGMSNDPNRNKELKNKMKELNDKYRKEEAALAEIEPTSDEKKAEAKRLRDDEKEKERLAKKALADEKEKERLAKEKEAGPKAPVDGTPTPTVDDDGKPAAGVTTTVPKEVKKTPEEIEQEKKKEDDRRAALSQEERDAEDDESMEGDAIKQAEDDDKKQADLGAEQDKVVKLKAAKAALAKAEESGDAAAIEKAKKAITDIEAKENWQLDGTRLGGMLNARVSKINSDAVLAESKYQSQSIAERLRRLL
jgi:hypothetical protein